MTGPSIAGIAYALPAHRRTVRELAHAGQLESDASVLEAFGFDRVCVATDESPYELARRAAQQLLDTLEVDPQTIELVLYGGTPSSMAFSPATESDIGAAGLCTTARFRYPATRLQSELGLDRASVMALDQLACTTLFGAIRIARAMTIAEGIDRVLCVSSEFFPWHAGREAIYNCTSDAACAVLIERDGTRNRILSASTITKGYYWDAEAIRDEMIASYFPTSKCVIERALAGAGWQASDVDWVVPHNVSLRSWQILLGLVRLPNAQLWSDNIATLGHTLAGDNFINLHDALERGAINRGDRVLLFSYGYGAHWTALALEA
jgi:3-oxoacyl-[acyl-carrier-protein] synthase III